jgi:hypothetical protein
VLTGSLPSSPSRWRRNPNLLDWLDTIPCDIQIMRSTIGAAPGESGIRAASFALRDPSHKKSNGKLGITP